MGSKQELTNAVLDMLKGNFSKAINLLESTNSQTSQTTNKIQLNIIITLSQAVSKPKLKDSLVTADIKRVIELSCAKISDPTQSEINNYYRSLYHILKYLCNKVIFCIFSLVV